MGGGGSREEEARNPPPGSSSARRRSEALLSLGDPRRFRAAPARPGEARGESGGRRPAPRPPAAAESPGPAGAGRGGAWERPAGGGGLGARGGGGAGSPSGWDQLARSLRGALSGAGQPRAGPSPASSGAFLCDFPPEPRGRSSPGAPFLPAASDHPAPPAERTADARRDGGTAPAVRGEPAGGGKGTKAAAGPGSGRAGEEGRLPPLMNINRACGLASRPGPAQTRVRAPARRRAQRAGRGRPPRFVFPAGVPHTFF